MPPRMAADRAIQLRRFPVRSPCIIGLKRKAFFGMP
jgi:hypothetical protein